MATDLRTLPSGHILSDYRIERVLGQGGFGITYLGTDTHLGRQVAIKEYYPREWATRSNTFSICATSGEDNQRDFDWGLNRFLKEAQLLARFEHPNIIAVRRFFQANGTAYLVMDYCDGRPLDEIIKSSGALSQEQLERIWYPLLDGLEQVHRIGFLHRDIKPANLYIRADGSPVLLDFGSAILENAQHARGVTVMVADGYAPMEQYDGDGIQGPFTDIYGLAATLYRAVTGEKPQASPGRSINDRIEPAAKKAKGRFAENLLAAIDSGMALRPEDRPQNVAQWRAILRTKSELVPSSERNDPLTTPSETLAQAVGAQNTDYVWKSSRNSNSLNRGYIWWVILGCVVLLVLWKFNLKEAPTALKASTPAANEPTEGRLPSKTNPTGKVIPPTPVPVDKKTPIQPSLPVQVESPPIRPPLAISPPPPPPPPTQTIRTAATVSASTCEKPEYPSASKRLEEEGTVQLKILVGTDGKVIESAVEKSSGFRRLDEAARAALSKCQFKPGTEDGVLIQSWASMKFTWRLE
jgi:TonB family protein